MSHSARYNFILVVVALSGCLAAFGGWRFAKASAPVNGPIVLVSVDSLRADHVSSYGYTQGRTPALDALAADGVLFERAYSHVPQTLPAHASLLTGRLPFETGVRDGAGFTLPERTRTIAELLRDRGYATGGIVSSFLLRKDTGINRGFAFFDDERTGDAGDLASTLTRDGGASEEIAEHWLDSIGTSRAFLFLHIAEPHSPHVAPGRFGDLEPYDAEVAYADEIVGRLVRYLKAHQLYDRATIVLTSDHGEGLGDHGEWGHGLFAYEPMLHVPLIIKEPGATAAGRRVRTPVQLIDVVPTILDFAKAPGASGLRGRSLTPLLGDGSVPEMPIYAESMFGQYRFGWAPVATVISGSFQLVSGVHEQPELFDLSKPEAERVDIATEKPQVVSALEQQLAELTIFKTPLAPRAVTPADRDRFELLGYVGVPQVRQGADAMMPADPAAFVEQFRAAVSLANSGEERAAVDAYTALTRQSPGDADLWMHLARTAARQERHDLALEAYAHALEIDPDNTAGHLGSAASNLRIRRMDEAELQARAVLSDDEAEAVQKAEAHEILARVALNRRDLDRARTEAQAAEGDDRQRPVQAFVEGRIAFEQQNYPQAVEMFQKALDAAKAANRTPLTDLRVSAAEALVRVGRAEDAEALLSAELAAFPANARARTVLQALLRASGRSKDAAALAHR